ncbi:Crp/Fnr family transcriptional regulator [Ruegeria arenilitoris]|uniref:Crp/Fnr family transcriptional regulator n=1 Tax=Ruegeria arenilitoris TaxID=1173585 RepID=UPI00147A6742|nr:Crp/Fnr family transcriptional regulator [Ruegeria arenilitoris]
MDRDEAVRYLRQNGWLSRLPDAVQQDWLSGARFHQISKGERIFEVEDDPRFMVGLASGSVGAYLSYHHDETRLVLLYEEGNWFGDAAVITGERHRGTGVARTDCAILLVPATHVEKVNERHPDVWRHISMNVLFQIDSYLTLTEAALNRDPVGRVITMLISLKKLNPRHSVFNLSNEEVGQMTGLTRNTANKCLRTLETAGAIERSYASIRVSDLQSLELHLRENSTK